MKNKSCSLKNGFFFMLFIAITQIALGQGSPVAPHKAAGYSVSEVQKMYTDGTISPPKQEFVNQVVLILQQSADQQQMKYADGSPVKFVATMPGLMDTIFRYTVVKDEPLTKGQFINYSWENGKFIPVPRELVSGEKGFYFDPNLTPYFSTKYEPIRYASNWCFNPQGKNSYQKAYTNTGKTDNGNGTTTEVVKVPAGEDGEDIYIFNYNTNTNTNTNTAPLTSTPPTNMLPTQSYSPGSAYCVADGQYYPQGNSQGQWCQQSNGQMRWVDWANLFLNAADLAVDIWSLWKLYDLAGTPETVVPPTVYNYYTTVNEGDEITNNYGDDDGDPDLPGNGDDGGPDLPDNGTPDLGENGKFANSGKSSNPFGGAGEVVKTEPIAVNQTVAGNIFGGSTSVGSPAVAVNQNAVAGNIFGGSVSTGSPNVEVNQTIAGNVFGAGTSVSSTGINTGAVLNDGIASVSPLNTSTGISNPFGGEAIAMVEVANLSGLTTTGFNGIQNPVNLGSNQIILNPSTGLPITNVVGQNGTIAVNGVPGTNGIQIVDGNGVISGPKGTGIQPIQINGVAVNGNIDGGGIKPITLIDQPTAATNIGFNGNQGGIDKNIVASQQQYNIGSVLSGNGGKPAGGLILNNTGNTGIQAKSAGVGTGGLIKNIKLK
ncbi:MAG: hypothetical protein KBF62_01905 [Candidatus Pacebacteria bacterium]|nr:hypothetical protein [Candidatus Paceibacterota bacterium]MBP9058373.1 hypothetical protein [Candidatus Paceibacterota bacterium]MBP9770364.1 hypothetical protein [Candidatus Paceibacterota bacterium]